MTLRIAITGIAGRMGREVVAAARAEGVDIVGGVVRPGADRSFPDVRVVDRLDDVLADADVVVDFTTPEATIEFAEVCVAAGRPFVSGTTGLSEAHYARLETLSTRVPIFHARNFSLGLATLLALLPQAGHALAGYDVEIVETHHRYKADAPSGTALALAEAVADVTGASLPDDAVFGRQGQALRRASEIGIHALRAGGNPGEHTVILANDGEEIRLAHRAFSRRPYASGALQAARFLVGHPAGHYGMADLIRPA